jgi:photosystem II stability/assembly factor-like uncharacterized protein
LRSTDGGTTWALLGRDQGVHGVIAVAVDPVARGTVYAGGNDGLYKTMDGGATWTRLAFPEGSVVALAVSPSAPNVVLGLGVQNRQGFVYRSEDGGVTWDERH